MFVWYKDFYLRVPEQTVLLWLDSKYKAGASCQKSWDPSTPSKMIIIHSLKDYSEIWWSFAYYIVLNV